MKTMLLIAMLGLMMTATAGDAGAPVGAPGRLLRSSPRPAREHDRLQWSGVSGKDIRADPSAYDELVNTWKSRATATLVIDGEVIIGFQANRQRVEALLA